MRPPTAYRTTSIFTVALALCSAYLAPFEKPSGPIVRPTLPAPLRAERDHGGHVDAQQWPTRASDVILEAYPLREPYLAALHQGDRIALPHPDGGTIDLVVARVTSMGDRRHLTLTHDGLPSTFTQAHGAFFGTLATTRGVYALEGNEQQAWLTRHAALDQRTNTHALDYRSLPRG